MMIPNSNVHLTNKEIFTCNNGIITSYNLESSISEKLGLYEKEYITIAGGGNYIIDFKVNKKNFIEKNIVPKFWRLKINNLIQNGQEPKYFDLNERYLDKDVIFISIPYGMPIYGHVLIEVLPRLFLLKVLYPDILKNHKIVLSGILPNWFFDILYELFDIDKSNIIIYNEYKEVITVKKAYIPSLLHTNYALHPIMNLFVTYVKDKFKIKPIKGYEKIYISRKNLKKELGPPRDFINSDYIEDYFFKKGYKIIYPQLLSFRQQVEIFSNSKMIVGPYGSGLHNTLFSDTHINVISFQRHTSVQDHIARLRHQNLYHINSNVSQTNSNNTSYKVNIDDIETVLKYIQNNKE